MNNTNGPKTQRRRLDPLQQFMHEFGGEDPATVLTLQKCPEHPKEAHEFFAFPKNELK